MLISYKLLTFLYLVLIITQNNSSSGQNVIFYHLDAQSKSLNKTRRLIGHGGSLKSSIYLTQVIRCLRSLKFKIKRFKDIKESNLSLSLDFLIQNASIIILSKMVLYNKFFLYVTNSKECFKRKCWHFSCITFSGKNPNPGRDFNSPLWELISSTLHFTFTV